MLSVGATPLRNAYSGVVLRPVLSNGFVCSGTEANLTECTLSGLGVANTCGHRAGVICRRECITVVWSGCVCRPNVV